MTVLRHAVDLSMLVTELPVLERPAAAARTAEDVVVAAGCGGCLGPEHEPSGDIALASLDWLPRDHRARGELA